MDRRFAGVVPQSRDYSCGLAALATLLTHYYQTPVTESALLHQLYGDPAAADLEQAEVEYRGVSFAVLAELAAGYGYRAAGFEVSYSDLRGLTRPVIVSLNIDGRAHFSVLRRIADDGAALLADPSWGNYRLPRHAFLKRYGKVSLLPGANTGSATNPGTAPAPADNGVSASEATLGRVLVLANSLRAEVDAGFMDFTPAAARLRPALQGWSP